MENNFLDDELSYWNSLKKDEENILSDLYPDVPTYYFDDKTDIFVENDKDEPTLSPYVTIKNLNTPIKENDCLKPKSAIEIGLKVTF